jgi:hypothetical protein
MVSDVEQMVFPSRDVGGKFVGKMLDPKIFNLGCEYLLQ